MLMSTIAGVDPRTGTPLPSVAESTSDDEVARLAEAAAGAAGAFADRGRDFRADLLTRIADEVEQARAALVATAARETGFADAKLDGELTRAAFQFRFFADVVRDGGYLEATIDPAGDTPMGPRPDLRRILVPLGPVAVFGASNFPFAFSVLGGDTASALAAGNPVIVKAHSSHPGTSQLSFDLIRRAVTAAGAPEAAPTETGSSPPARAATGEVPGQVLLNERIYRSYNDEVERYGAHRGVQASTTGKPAGGAFGVASRLFETNVDGLRDHPVEEIFGPVTVIARYDTNVVTGEIDRALATLANSLTATLHADEAETTLTAELVARVRARAGRIVFNGFPTGVAVSWAQHHGGPWPSTNSIHTSVGATAIRRFLRPVTYQDAPEHVLPEELRDDYTSIPRRINGIQHALT
jgi:acyl-CoA reductase-like NAD-dependent aldehyde dehydrogenase